ncbi:MAG: pentapeptide repeat-containing protein [Bacteroidota bacterium]|nr:pentapeptide repeat-containing protein [Bacteroidota bacterium]
MKTLSLLLLPLLFINSHSANHTSQRIKPLAMADSGQIKTDTVYCYKSSDRLGQSELCGKIFRENTYFTNSCFTPGMNFASAYFKKDAVFAGVTFKSLADFSGATFFRDLNFSSCKFHKFLFLSGIFTDSITTMYFYNASLPELIDFSHNTFLGRTVDFTNANFDSLAREKFFWKDRRHFINVYNSDITKVKIGYTHFRMCFYDPQKKDKVLTPYLERLKKQYTTDTIVNGKATKIWNVRAIYNVLTPTAIYKDYIAETFPSASLTDTVIRNYTYFYISQGSFPARLYEDQIDALYSRLLKNFDTNGQMDSYQLLDIDYQDYTWSNKTWVISWFYIFPKYWNFYGHDRELIFGWTIFFLLTFTLISFFFYERVFEGAGKNKGVYDLENGPKISANSKHPRLDKLRCAFVYTSLIFFTFSIKTERLNFKKPAFFYIVIINIFGLLCLAYLANFILQK